MASTAEGSREDAGIAHLPDASADLTVSVEGVQLKLHSIVLAAGSGCYGLLSHAAATPLHRRQSSGQGG